jgi:hypothetical protein
MHRQTFTTGTISSDNSFGSWTQADLPIKLRMIYYPTKKTMEYAYCFVGSGGEWKTVYASTGAYALGITDTYSAAALYFRNAGTTNSSTCSFSSIKSWSGMGPINDNGYVGNSTDNASGWLGEEDLAGDYPLALTATPDEDDQQIFFDIPTPMKRGNAMKLRTKDFGGDYNYSKTFYITTLDEINVGPDGTDQYIGMRLLFDFSLGVDDELAFDTVEFTYEVI